MNKYSIALEKLAAILEARANVPEEKIKLYKRGVSFDDTQKRLKTLVGKGITLKSSDGVEARISRRSIGKLMSNAAVQKSKDNKFTREQHYAAASDIASLFRNSVRVLTHPDTRKSLDVVAMHRFAAPLFENNAAYITVKEATEQGKRIYTVELIEMGRLEGILEELGKNPTSSPATSPPSDNIQKKSKRTAAATGGQMKQAAKSKKEERLHDLAFGFSETLNKIPGIRILPDITAGDDLNVEFYEGNPEAAIYISNPELNEGGSHFAYANLSLDGKNNLYVNLEGEFKNPKKDFIGTINGEPAEVARKLKAKMIEQGKAAKAMGGGFARCQEPKAWLVISSPARIPYCSTVQNERGIIITRLQGFGYDIEVVNDTRNTAIFKKRFENIYNNTVIFQFKIKGFKARYDLEMSKETAKDFEKLKNRETMRFALVKSDLEL